MFLEELVGDVEHLRGPATRRSISAVRRSGQPQQLLALTNVFVLFLSTTLPHADERIYLHDAAKKLAELLKNVFQKSEFSVNFAREHPGWKMVFLDVLCELASVELSGSGMEGECTFPPLMTA